jgi:hypothetical protein
MPDRSAVSGSSGSGRTFSIPSRVTRVARNVGRNGETTPKPSISTSVPVSSLSATPVCTKVLPDPSRMWKPWLSCWVTMPRTLTGVSGPYPAVSRRATSSRGLFPPSACGVVGITESSDGTKKCRSVICRWELKIVPNTPRSSTGRWTRSAARFPAPGNMGISALKVWP